MGGGDKHWSRIRVFHRSLSMCVFPRGQTNSGRETMQFFVRTQGGLVEKTQERQREKSASGARRREHKASDGWSKCRDRNNPAWKGRKRQHKRRTTPRSHRPLLAVSSNSSSIIVAGGLAANNLGRIARKQRRRKGRDIPSLWLLTTVLQELTRDDAARCLAGGGAWLARAVARRGADRAALAARRHLSRRGARSDRHLAAAPKPVHRRRRTPDPAASARPSRRATRGE